MKNALQLCSLALNPLSPSPTASMVRIDNGFMQAFGGTFCISVPVAVEVGCCFNPGMVSSFFRKERKAVSWTLDKNKLVLKEGKERLSVPSLPAEEMVILDVLGKPTRCRFDRTHLKLLTDIIDPAHSKVSCQGVQFRYGMIEATNGHVVISAESDLDEELEFNLPVDAAKALLRVKANVVSVVCDGHAVKFNFEDGSSLASLVLPEELVETRPFYESAWQPIRLKDAVAKDLLTIDCERVVFLDGNVNYVVGTSNGTIEGCCDKQIIATIKKKNLDTLLKISYDMAMSEEGSRIQAFSDRCRGISVTMR